MLLTVYCVRQDLSEVTFSLDVDGDFELENFRALCELESGIPAAESLIFYAERPLTDNHRSLSSYGLKDGDVVILRQRDPAEQQAAAPFPGLPRIDFSSIAVPGTSRDPPAPQPRATPPDSTTFPQGLDNPTLLREMLLANPHELSLLKERNPPLAEALLSGDLEKFTKVLLEQQQERARREQERIRLFSADPFDLEAQAKIEEDIRQQNIEENMTIAMEEAPESFGQVVMLYINCKVNGYPVKAFVDSGAQMTIMSQACAERCHIMRLVDRRWAGIAKGVGTQKIIGRVHLAQVQIEGDFLPCSFSILEEQPMDMLLGLDMLKRHQCSIDLEKNVLVIGTTGTRTSFLPEGELPECARLAYGPGREDMQPEEIADRELAEVMQKSAEEADTETTSLKTPSLVPLTDGLDSPAHYSGKASNPLVRSVSMPTTVGSRPSMVGDSTETLTILSNAEASRDGSQGSFSDDGIQTEHPPPVLVPSIGTQDSESESLDPCKLATRLMASDVLDADRATEATQALSKEASEQEPNDCLVPDLPLDMHQQVEPSQSTPETKLPQPSLCMQGQGEEAGWKLHSAVNPSTTDLLHACTADLPQGAEEDLCEGTLSVSNKEAPMEIDIPSSSSSVLDTSYEDQRCRDASENHQYSHVQGGGAAVHSMVTTQGSSDGVTHFIDSRECGGIPEATDSPGENCSILPNSSVQDVEDHCLSLATALKELHKLLLMSGQGSCRSAPNENPPHITSMITESKDENNIVEPCQKGCLNNSPATQNVTAVSETDHSVGGEEISSLGITKGSNAAQNNSNPLNLDCVVGSSQTTEAVGRPDGPALCDPTGSCLSDSEVAVELPDTHSDCLLNSQTDPPITREESSVKDCSNNKDPDCDDKIPETHPELGRLQGDVPTATGRSPYSAPLFPPSATGLIVSAGFTLQDAINALERAGGNAELALLSLLAKNIVVPT